MGAKRLVNGGGYRRWGGEEEAILIKMRRERCTMAEIADALGRSHTSIRGRVEWLTKREVIPTLYDEPRTYEQAVEMFWARVDRGAPNDCWTWRNPTIRHFGYGGVSFSFPGFGSKPPAHRVAWTIERGPIPSGLIVRHKCDNPPCCNPNHLELGTYKDNSRDMQERGRHPTKGKKLQSPVWL